MLIPIPASILMNRMLGPIDRGIFANLLLIPSVAATLVGCNWDRILRSYLVGKTSPPSDLVNVTAFFLALQFVIGVTLSIIYVILNPHLYVGYIDFAIFAILIAVPLQLGANYASSFLVCLKPPISAYKVKIIGVTFFLLATLLFIWLTKLTIFTAFISNQMVSLSMLVWTVFIFHNSPPKVPGIKDVKKYAKQLTGSLPSHIVESIASQLDIFLVIRFVGFAEAGAYIAFRVLELPFKAIMLSVINVTSSIIDIDRQVYLKKFVYLPTLVLLFISLLMLGGVSLISPILSEVLGSRYRDMYWILGYMFFIFSLSNAYELSLNSVMMTGHRQIYFNIKLAVALMRITTLICFISAFGFIGVFYALIISATTGLVLSITSLRLSRITV